MNLRLFQKVLQPNMIVDSLDDITIEKLKALGIRAICLDVDDTIMASNRPEIEGHCLAWIAEAKKEFRMLLLSNGSRARVNQCAERLDMLAFPLVGKPLPFAFHRGLRALASCPEETAVIGDQVFTDVLGANLVGAYSVWVHPLSPGRRHTRCLRRVEAWIIQATHQSLK